MHRPLRGFRYVALPYMSPVVEARAYRGYAESVHWQDSIMDNLIHEGLAHWDGNNITAGPGPA